MKLYIGLGVISGHKTSYASYEYREVIRLGHNNVLTTIVLVYQKFPKSILLMQTNYSVEIAILVLPSLHYSR